MKKTDNLGPIRISEDDKKTLEDAANRAGVVLASKIRELALSWARKVLK